MPKYTDDNVPLREYVDLRINELKESIQSAREGMDHRLDGMNEFRDSLRDQSEKFASKESVETLSQRFQEMRERGPMAIMDIAMKIAILVVGGYLVYKLTTGRIQWPETRTGSAYSSQPSR